MLMTAAQNKWICIQLGSREHYAIPRMLHRAGNLECLLTDSWVSSKAQPWVARASKSLSLRRHDEIPDSLVHAATVSRIAFDIHMRMSKSTTWDAILKRNQWFQEFAARYLEQKKDNANVCFSYSYTARLPFRAAKKRGMKCILGQIDPGPIEYDVVETASKEYQHIRLAHEDQPSHQYWEEWREEVELADEIIVNSEWSKELLIRQGISDDKIRVLPLAYEVPNHASSVKPQKNSRNNLSVLFLGQVILRKGVGQLFDAIRLLQDSPVEFVIAGPIGVKVPEDISKNPHVTFTGPVDGETVRKLYQSADVFILPTLSDGFAITQLEAMAFGLPVIASRYCGDVVSEGENGLILERVSPHCIAEILLSLTKGNLLSSMKDNLTIPSRFRLSEIVKLLVHTNE
jgi:glycosyltransferase involved in cell wall biosynthesis